MGQCPYAELLNPATYVNGFPHQELKKMRDDAPIIKMPDPITGIPYWAVLRREEIDFISKNPALFSYAQRAAVPMEYDDDGTMDIMHLQMINMDPPQHLKYRRIVRRTFTAKKIAELEPVFRQHAKAIIDRVIHRGECEFVQDVAAELPLIAILELLGIPLQERKMFFDWTNTMIFADDPDMSIGEDAGHQAAIEVISYARMLAEKYKDSPADENIVAQLMDGSIDGESLDLDEFSWFFVLLLVGGNESTRSVMAHGMRMLMENPDQLQLLKQDPSLIPGAIEEMLRFNTAFNCMRRTATQDIALGGQEIKKGDKVIMFYPSAGQDESVFGADAMKFDVTRGQRMPELKNEHRAFGVGEHFCIGSHLARLELKVMFEEIIPRMSHPKFAQPVKYVRSYFVNAMKEMKITFEKAH
jgi:cytochrome P450